MSWNEFLLYWGRSANLKAFSNYHRAAYRGNLRMLPMSSSDCHRRQVILRPDGTFLLTSACDIYQIFGK